MQSQKQDRAAADQPGLTLLILARDEQAVLPRLLTELMSQVVAGDEVHVVADHCRDDSARVAQACGARVHIRRVGQPSKGRALRWWLRRTRGAMGPYEYVVILDADSLPAPDWLSSLRSRLASTSPAALQSYVEPWVRPASPIPLLAALSETVEQRVYDRLRSWLGWSVRLRGTGMALQRGWLDRLEPNLHTEAEDAELSLLLTAAGAHIEAERTAVVMDPKPKDAAAARRQRTRWFKGQVRIMLRHPAAFSRLLLRGPEGWSLLSSVIFKPRSLFITLKLCAAFGLLAAAGGHGPLVLLSLTLGALVAVEALTIFACAAARDSSRSQLKACLHLPAFGWMWLMSVALALVGTEPWPRARSRQLEPPLNELEAHSS